MNSTWRPSLLRQNRNYIGTTGSVCNTDFEIPEEVQTELLKKISAAEETVVVFRIMGIDLMARSMFKDRLYITVMTIGPLTLFIGPMIFGVKANIKDVSMLTDSMAALLACNMTVLKFTTFSFYRKDFVDLINRVRDILTKESSENVIYAKIAIDENKRDQVLSKIYVIFFVSAGVFACLKPFVIMLIAYIRTGSLNLELPYSAVYPWNYEYIPFYIPTYLWNCTVGYTAVTMSLCVDTLLFSFTHNACAILKIAQHKVLHLQPNENESQILADYFHLHQFGLTLSQELDEKFKPLIFAQFFISSLQLCVIGFQVSDLFPQPQCIYFIAFGVSLLIELYIYSHCGEHLKESSTGYAMAIYNSQWYCLSKGSKRSLMIAAQRAQQPCKLNGYFFEANMTTFSTIVRTAMSYIMMLRSFSE